ncbi:hypothetical protein [Amycolatopsis sp. NPDC004079]|uniref:hypothetical protein n=1 Tax=Amycolatopsis sp. NPDC004079 TaxID=3154549 RepID=UPI00339F8D51
MSTTLDRQTIRDVAYRTDLEPDDVVRDSYSGRAMYGETCFALYVDKIADAVKFLVRFGQEQPQDACRLADDMRCDQMGLGQVVYFPGWRLTAEENNE